MNAYSRTYTLPHTLGTTTLIITIDGKLCQTLVSQYNDPGHALDRFCRPMYNHLFAIHDTITELAREGGATPHDTTFGRRVCLTLGNKTIAQVQLLVAMRYQLQNSVEIDKKVEDCVAFALNQFRPYLVHLQDGGDDDHNPPGVLAKVYSMTARRFGRTSRSLRPANGDVA